MHVAYSVPENQIKCKSEYRNTQQVQYGTIRTWSMNNIRTSLRNMIYLKMVLRVLAAPAQNLPACWLELTNLPQCWLKIYQHAPLKFRRKVSDRINTKYEEPSTMEAQPIAQSSTKRLDSSCTCVRSTDKRISPDASSSQPVGESALRNYSNKLQE
jgi:hypothetical protein